MRPWVTEDYEKPKFEPEDIINIRPMTDLS